MKALIAAVLLGSTAARAADGVDVTQLYTLTTEGSTAVVQRGEQGKFVLSITTVDGAYVSAEAPLRIELTGKNAQVSNSRLTSKDSVAQGEQKDKKFADPRFEVPFKASAAKGAIEAKATFFICTKTLCVRQQRTVAQPFELAARPRPGRDTP